MAVPKKVLEAYDKQRREFAEFLLKVADEISECRKILRGEIV